MYHHIIGKNDDGCCFVAGPLLKSTHYLFGRALVSSYLAGVLLDVRTSQALDEPNGSLVTLNMPYEFRSKFIIFA